MMTLGKQDLEELKSLIETTKVFAFKKLFTTILNQTNLNFDETFEKKVDEIHDLIETPQEIIRKYLIYTKGNKESAIDLILTNFDLPEITKNEEKTEKKVEKKKR